MYLKQWDYQKKCGGKDTKVGAVILGVPEGGWEGEHNMMKTCCIHMYEIVKNHVKYSQKMSFLETF